MWGFLLRVYSGVYSRFLWLAVRVISLSPLMRPSGLCHHLQIWPSWSFPQFGFDGRFCAGVL
ncbi:predicted protein [Mycobacterium tuberculosis T17]|nr:predicted protein [Mycobacterium tuberculosis T17]